MRRRKDFGVCVRAAWGLAFIGTAAMAIAQSLLPAADGWYAWGVTTASDAHRCCFDWRNQNAENGVCRLDSDGQSFATRDTVQRPASSGEAVIYVKQVNGRLERAVALSSDCAVRTQSPVVPLEDVSAAQSVALLRAQLGHSRRLTDDVLGAIAAHAAPQAALALRDIANGDAAEKVRRQAWFWLAQTAWDGTEEAVFGALAAETQEKVRHAQIFALSQLPEARAADALIRVVEDGALATHDRKQALFWLAQNDSERSLDYLSRVLDD